MSSVQLKDLKRFSVSHKILKRLKYLKGCSFFVLSLGCIISTNLAAKMPILSLPKPVLSKNIDLNIAIQKRRSIRSFKNKALTLSQISQLLWAGQGITDVKSHFRSAPSAGGLYPLELYLVKDDGVWHYQINEHQLELVKKGDFKAELANAALAQVSIKQAPINIVIAAVYQKTSFKYGERGIQYVHIEAGHAAQNILLEAVALNLSSVPIGAFSDDAVRSLLNLPANQVPLYILPVGYPSK